MIKRAIEFIRTTWCGLHLDTSHSEEDLLHFSGDASFKRLDETDAEFRERIRARLQDDSDASYMKGNRAAYARILVLVAGELGADTTEGKLAAMLAERAAVVSALRDLCETYGDNDWSDNLYLPDVIEKHFVRHLVEECEDAAAEVGGG